MAVGLLLPAPGPATAAMPTGWISLDGTTLHPSPPVIEYVSSSTQELVLRVHTPGVLSTAEFDGEDEFRRLEIPGYYRTTEVGSPAVPAVRQLIAIPSGCEMDVDVSIPDTVRYSGSSLYPVPEMVVAYTEEGYEYAAEEFAYDGQAYGRSTFYPGVTAVTGTEGMLRGQGVALLTVYPVQHAPAEEETELYPTVEVTLTFRGGTGGLAEDLGPLTSVARAVLPNYQGIDWPVRGQGVPGEYGWCTSVADCQTLNADYLMIVHGPLKASGWVDALAAHRASYNCYNVAMVTDATVTAHSGDPSISPEAILQFIQDLYDEGGASHMTDARLGYVLLVGEARADSADAYIPARQEPNVDLPDDDDIATTDHWYACLEIAGATDRCADLMIGRLCAVNATELQRDVERTIAYETEATQESWREEALLSCGFCTTTDLSKVGSVSAAYDELRNLLAVESGYTVSEVYAHEQSFPLCSNQQEAARALNVSAVNEGRHVVELCAHGCLHGAETFKRFDVPLLANGGELPFWMSFSCNTGAYDVFDGGLAGNQPWRCLGERLMHEQDDAGAVAYFGASELSNSLLSWPHLGRYAWHGLVAYDQWELGKLLAYAKLEHLSRADDEAEVLIYNLLGDPALNLMLTDSDGYGSGPDFVVRQPDITASPVLPTSGTTMTFTAEIHNDSNYHADDPVQVTFSLCEIDGQGCGAIGTDTVQPDAWDSETAECTWVVPSNDDGVEAGARLLSVEVATAPNELSTDNNEAHVPLGIYYERDGFPLDLGGTGGLTPTVADIDGSVVGLEVVAATRDPARVVVLADDGTELGSMVAGGTQTVVDPAAIGDLDLDGALEIVVCASDSIYATDANGDRLWGVRRAGVRSTPTLVDGALGDGNVEVLIEATRIGYHFVQLRSEDDGSLVRGCPSPQGDASAVPAVLGPATADLNADGHPDLVSSYGGGLWGQLVAFDGSSENCAELWSASIGDFGDDSVPCSPIVADVNSGESGLEVICGAERLDCYSGVDGDRLWRRDLRGSVAGVSVEDLDDDGDLEIVASTYGTGSVPGDTLGFLYVLDGAGAPVDSMPLGFTPIGQPVMARFDSEGDMEIVVAGSFTQDVWSYPRDMSHVHVFAFSSGTLGPSAELPRPLFFWGELSGMPTLADTNDDSHIEIWIADADGYLHCIEHTAETGTLSRWPCYQHDERHTGVYETAVAGTYPDNTPVSWWGDYYVTGDVTVTNGSNLLVQPGTTVRVAPDSDSQESGTDSTLSEIIVLQDGSIEAYGTEQCPTRFLSASDTSEEGQWWGIRAVAQGGVRPTLAKLRGVEISDACMGISAVNEEELDVRGCTITACEMKGIKRAGTAPNSAVTVAGNTISECPVGMELYSCDARVDSNQIIDCTLYGMRIYQDRGSLVRDNVIQGTGSAYTPFTGIWYEAAQDSLKILRNEISQTKIGIYADRSLYGTIEENTIRGAGTATALRGMYFYDSDGSVAKNTIIGYMGISYFVYVTDGTHPTLGIANGGDTTCAGASYPRCNRLIYMPPQEPKYFVKVTSGPATVMAEGNWWGCAEPDSDMFYGPVDWTPHLSMDPLTRGDGNASASTNPHNLELLQNFPNPLNPATMLRYSVPEERHVSICLFDLSGRRVRVLVDEVREPGWHEAVWDGRDDHGERVASGVYFCRLDDGRSVASRKVVLLK